jgi:regulatory protein
VTDPSEPRPLPGRDAEAWLAARGVARESVRVPVPVPEPDATAHAAQPRGSSGDAPRGEGPAVVATEPGRPELGSEVTKAVSFIRRSTANTPQSSARLRRRLRERDVPATVIDLALRRAAQERLVDDAAMATSLVDEGRRKGHAPARIQADLERRELPADVVQKALEDIGDRDLEAVAFAVARERARRLRGVEPEAAFRRVVGHLGRRGYPDLMARKVARLAVFEDREPDRVAGH